jgi:molybdopterin synthase sulfur carrier subunit
MRREGVVSAPQPVIVEFYGVPRLRAGRATLEIPPGTAADVLRAVSRACPGLGDLCVGDRLASHYLLSRDGRMFLGDLSQPVVAGEHLLLLSADAGG